MYCGHTSQTSEMVVNFDRLSVKIETLENFPLYSISTSRSYTLKYHSDNHLYKSVLSHSQGASHVSKHSDYTDRTQSTHYTRIKS